MPKDTGKSRKNLWDTAFSNVGRGNDGRTNSQDVARAITAISGICPPMPSFAPLPPPPLQPPQLQQFSRSNQPQSSLSPSNPPPLLRSPRPPPPPPNENNVPTP